MSEITMTELARGLSDFINRATYRREAFVITRGGKPVASLGPIPSGVRVSDLESIFDALPRLPAGDFPAFETAIAEARDSSNDPITDPWPSS